MKPEMFAHSFYLYILPEDLIAVKEALISEGLFIHFDGYSHHNNYFKMTWYVSDEKKVETLCPYAFEVEKEGAFKGFYFFRFYWAGPADASHLRDFKNKYKLGLYGLGHSGDWLGEAICMLFSRSTKRACRELLLKMKQENKERMK